MRFLLQSLFALLLSFSAGAQWFTTSHTTGTAVYGPFSVTATGGGTAAVYALWCGTGPYWIGAGTGGTPNPGWYDFTCAPTVTSARILITAADPGESIDISINGTRYPLTTANLTPWPSTCGTPSMGISGDTLLSSGSNSSAILNITFCPMATIRVRTNGIMNGSVFTFMITDSGACFRAVDNDPCYGDTLQLLAIGDSLGATYSWIGPGGFTSTEQNPFRFPATFADSGLYRVIRTNGTAMDTAFTRVAVHPLPIVTVSNNSPLCDGQGDTLKLSVTPFSTTDTFRWTGPNLFTSTAQAPIRLGFGRPDTGIYRVVVTTRYGCKDSGTTRAWLIPRPAKPTISGVTPYCQGVPFVPYVISGTSHPVYWYTTATGGVGGTTPLTVNTSVTGYTTVWVSQKAGSCESERQSFTTKVKPTPPAPVVVGTMGYCQFIGPFVPLTITTLPGAIARWYTVPTGGTATSTHPVPNLNVAGVYNSWVSQVDSGCEGPRTPVTITIHPKPAPPSVTPWVTCQYITPGPLVATALAGHTLRWYGTGITSTGTLVAPTPNVNVADIDTYYVTQTSAFGCISDSSMLRTQVKPEPAPPVTRDTTYCQGAVAARLMAIGEPGSTMKWYVSGPVGGAPGGATLAIAPKPSNTLPGDSTWYVTQVSAGCESRKAAITVTTLPSPQFEIEALQPWVCQFDSITLSYKGAAQVDPSYQWIFPTGAGVANGSLATDSTIMAKFDSAGTDTYVYLTVSNYKGRCSATDTVRIKVVPQPDAKSYSKRDVCLGDTVSLALANKSDNANKYQWEVDFLPLGTTKALNIVSHNSNSGGPFLISWVDTGSHIIEVNAVSAEGCKSEPALDTIHVHVLPDASFKITTRAGQLCIDDSVLFEAKEDNYSYAYEWQPARSFDNNNRPAIWGRVAQERSLITLKVTDPFGCAGTYTREINPATCCKVVFPSAFTPNGDTKNDYFRPIIDGFHRFHVFRVTNRWGQTVYESANSNLKWDGTFNGELQDMGVYFYYLQYDCGGEKLEARGDVTLIR